MSGNNNTVLEVIDDSIWLVEGELVNFYGFPYPTRSVIVRLHNGDLWIWSPIRLTPALREEVGKLGRVTHLVSPNKIHHLYLQEWQDAFPGALLWGPQTIIDKRKDLDFQPPLADQPPAAWRDEIDQFWFQGSVFMDEIVFFHRSSRTAIFADLSENFSHEFLLEHWRGWQRLLARIWKMTVGYGYAPLEWRLSWLNRKPARAALQRLIAMEPQRVVMAHGEWQRRNGRDYLIQAFTWLHP